MKLYINTSDRYKRIVRLMEGEKIVTEKITDGDVLVAIQNLLDAQRLTLDAIDKVEAHPGPGSFTGLRVGVSIANAINYALGRIGPKEITVPEYGKEPNITKSKRISGK